MIITNIECGVTEYDNTPPKNNTKNRFSISDKSVTIAACNSKGDPLYKTEISIEDATELARIILYVNGKTF
jgi:hypothetical protein